MSIRRPLRRPALLYLALSAALVSSQCSGSGGTTAAPVVTAPSTPTTSAVPAAPIARFGYAVDGASVRVALAGFNSVSFDASNSSGTGLRYGLDFGDGAGADAATATHVYRLAGSYTARVIVTDTLGRTDTLSLPIQVATLDGGWTNGFQNNAAGRYEFRTIEIAQKDNALTGSYRHPEGNLSSMRGELRPGTGAVLRLDDGTISFTSSQASAVLLDSPLRLVLTMQGGSASGQTLTFSKSYWAPCIHAAPRDLVPPLRRW